MSNYFKVYDINNFSNIGSNVYIGSTYIANISTSKTEKTDFTTYLFASIVGGRNIRIDQPTEKEPYIFIDSRFYHFKPYSYYVDFNNNIDINLLETTNYSLNNSILKSINYINGDVYVNIKNIESPNITIYIDFKTNELTLKAPEYNLKNTKSNNVVSFNLLTKKSKNEFGNTSFHINKLIE